MKGAFKLSTYATRFNIIPRLPKPISWFLGYRASAPKPIPEWLRLTSVFLATMAAMLVNLAVSERAPLMHKWNIEELVPSFAASCVLIYGSIDVPFSQPRNLVLGHFLSALVGVCIMRLFMTNSHNEKYLWLAGALSVACATIVMDVTGTTHPPAGATALLPAISPSYRELSWNFLPLMLIHSCLFLGIAMLCNNVVRRYPKYWVAASPPPPASIPPPAISITADGIDVPRGVSLSDEENELLRQLQKKLFEA